MISEEISKEVVRVERWKGRIIMPWTTIRKQLVCLKIMSVYGPRREGQDNQVGEMYRWNCYIMQGEGESDIRRALGGS